MLAARLDRLIPFVALLASCDCSSAGSVDASTPVDVGTDAFVSVDSGSPWECASDLCCPALEDRTARSEGDTQLRRDLDRARAALSSCLSGEDCVGGTLTVGTDGVIDAVTAVPASDTPDERACVEGALLGLCLPALVGMGEQEVQLCGI